MAARTYPKPDPTLLVLTSLAAGAKHGYGIMKDIESFSGVTLGPGTVFGCLARLEERGLVRPVAAEERRRPYELTAAGSRALEAQLDELGRVVATTSERLGRRPRRGTARA